MLLQRKARIEDQKVALRQFDAVSVIHAGSICYDSLQVTLFISIKLVSGFASTSSSILGSDTLPVIFVLDIIAKVSIFDGEAKLSLTTRDHSRHPDNFPAE